MLAGARIRGEFEERLKSALTLLSASKGEFVLLIDGLHMIVGTGGGDGGMDVSNMLKPMLARGELRLIGSSAPDEYRKYVEKDAALERQFQPVYVEPPSARATVEILRGLRERHEVMTSNLREDPKDFFKPEFINRIDEIVRFRSCNES